MYYYQLPGRHNMQWTEDKNKNLGSNSGVRQWTNECPFMTMAKPEFSSNSALSSSSSSSIFSGSFLSRYKVATSALNVTTETAGGWTFFSLLCCPADFVCDTPFATTELPIILFRWNSIRFKKIVICGWESTSQYLSRKKNAFIDQSFTYWLDEMCWQF